MKVVNGKKCYPLTAAQRLHLYYQGTCPKKEVLNMGTSLTFQQNLDYNVLKEAVSRAYDRCEAMRLRFTEDKEGNVWQYVVEKEERELELFDFTGWEGWAAEMRMRKWTSIPFEQYDAPRNRVVAIVTPDGYQGLYLLADRMTMDEYAMQMFLKDVVDIYCCIKFDDIDEPKKMASYMEQVEKDLSYEDESSEEKKDKTFFEKKITSSEPIYNSIYGSIKLVAEQIKEQNPDLRAAGNSATGITSDVEMFELEEEPTERLLAFCREHQVDMESLLMMGARTYLQRLNENEDVSITTTIPRRDTDEEKRCGGSRGHYFPLRTIIRKSDTFMEGLLKIDCEQKKIQEHGNYDPIAFYAYRKDYYNLKEDQTYEPFCLTYVPVSLKEERLGSLNEIPQKDVWYSNGSSILALKLTVMHRTEDNGLNFYFEHQFGALNYEKLQKVYYYLCRILFEGIQNPNLTVKEILELL